MRKLTTALALLAICGSVFAQQASCNASATEKKLAGAAKTAFLKKCEAEATEKCEATAAEKKLAGAAKTASVKKCVNEAVGS